MVKPSAFHFICSRYRKHKGEEQCTPHSIRESVLDEIILEEIRRITYYARTKTKEFAEFINQKTSAESRKELSAKSAELGKLKKRKNELESLFKRLYEDNVLGRITDDQFHMLSGGYTSEQKDVELRIPELEDEIETLKSTATNTDINTVSRFDVRYVIGVMPYFALYDVRRLVDFEFLIFGRMRIIKSKLPERYKFADKFKKK